MRYEPSELFASTAPYYARYRPGYPEQLFMFLRDRFGLDGTQRALDLGAGAGALALPLAGYVAQAIAVDPDPGMLAEGRKLAAERQIANIEWRLGDSYGLAALDIGPVLLVTMGASFHWMDRDQVLADLDRIVLPGGGVVVVSGGAPGTAKTEPWMDVVAAVRATWLGDQRRAGGATYSHPDDRHETVLRRSIFSAVEVARWERDLTLSMDEVIGLQFSYSYSSPAQLGGRKTERVARFRRGPPPPPRPFPASASRRPPPA